MNSATLTIMLPKNLVSSYSRYKQDMDSIASWLATTAHRRGYTSESPALSKSAKKRNKKKGKTKDGGNTSQPQQTHGQRTYTISIKDFTILAEFIAAQDEPRIHVPPRLAALLDRTITTRQFFSSAIGPYL